MWLEGLRHPLPVADRAFCARCGGRVEVLSLGHYGSTCLATWTEQRFHFCCPETTLGCELQEAQRA